MNSNDTITHSRDPIPDAPVILFDGVCNLCHRAVRWVIRRDPRGIFRFASLQSNAARRLLTGRVQGDLPDGVVLISGGDIRLKSDAWIQIFRLLGPRWSWLHFLGIFPKNLRDRVYDMVAAKRYRWFGKLDICPIPDPKLKDRFLD